MTYDSAFLRALKWRNIGPHIGGRVVAVAGHPTEPLTFYFGACAGGVWKTEDGGTYWENISDGSFNTAAIGAIAVAEADPNVIYVGTGETCIRSDSSHGDGVYRSSDGGHTWEHLGLEETRHIPRIRIDPHDPDTVYVAALGHAFGPNPERGIYRSRDGGQTWERSLFVSEQAGASDLTIDVTNPRVLYAGIWQVRREPWGITSGGPESGIYKSSDGGDEWERISDNPGMPAEIKDRIGVAVSPARPDRVWAVFDAAAGSGGVFRSDDGGTTWERVADSSEFTSRSWYFGHIYAHPTDPEAVFCLNVRFWKSADGGRHFDQITPPHQDNHDLWLDPRHPDRMITGNDGGAAVSFNGGASWSTIYNQPTGPFYRVATDNQFPYRVYGTQQDNTAFSVPSRTRVGGIRVADGYPVGPSESGFIAVHPEDPNIVYSTAMGGLVGAGGAVLRYDHRTGQHRGISVWPESFRGTHPKDLKHRFNWILPFALSPHDPRLLYTAGECVFRSRDEGNSWEQISPDLTRNDPATQLASGGPVSLDTSGVEHYATLSIVVESPHEAGTLWVGSDDGLVHLSRDGGETWDSVTPPELPEWAYINTIEVSPHDSGTAYLAADRYKLDDLRPYLFKTTDYGKTWRPLHGDLPSHTPTRVIREDPRRAGLLFVGTESGVSASFDDGESWQALRLNLPVVPVYDMTIKDDDLVVATHGRSFWILDDLTPIRELTEEVAARPLHLFPPRPTYRFGEFERAAGPGKNYRVVAGTSFTFYEREGPNGDSERVFLDVGENLPNGVLIHYSLQERPAEPVAITILDAERTALRTFTSDAPPPEAPDSPPPIGPRHPRPTTAPGLNRFVWDMRAPPAGAVPGDAATLPGLPGPLVPPGVYQVRLSAGGENRTATFEIRKDPHVSATQEDLEEQFQLLLQIRDTLSAVNDAVNRERDLHSQLTAWLERALTAEQRPPADPLQAAKRLVAELERIDDALGQRKVRSAVDIPRFKLGLSGQLAEFIPFVAAADAAPTQPSQQIFAEMAGRADQHLRALQTLIDQDLAELNRRIDEAGEAGGGAIRVRPAARPS